MKRLLNIDYALIQAFFWMLYCPAGVFVSAILLEKEYSNFSIGVIIAVGSLLAILMETIIAHITDRVSSLTDIKMIKILIFALILAVLLVLFIGEKSIALTIAYIGLVVIHTTMHPFVNALSFTLEETGYQVSYGAGRSMGSLAAGLMCFAMGYFIAWFNSDVVLYAALFLLVLMALVIFRTDYHYKNAMVSSEIQMKAISKERTNDPAEEVQIGMPEFIRRNKIFVVMSVGIIGLFFGNVIVENFALQIVQSIGGSTENMGIIIFLLSIFEMPTMLGFNKLKNHFSYAFLLRVSAVFFSLKIVIMYFAGTMMTFYLAQLCQVLGYGLLFPAIVSFTDHIMEKGEALRGQAIFTVALTLGNVIGSVVGGVILDLYTAHILLMAGSIVSAAGTILIVALVHRVEIENARRKSA